MTDCVEDQGRIGGRELKNRQNVTSGLKPGLGRLIMNMDLSRNEKLTPQQLRHELQQEKTADLKLRRGSLPCRWWAWRA